MDKFQIDFQKLGEAVITDPYRIPLKGNEHRLVRIAFDLFHLKDGNPEDIWQVQSSDDGEFLVRTYALPEDEDKKITASSKWSVEIDKKEENLTIAYRNIPLLRLAAKNYGVSSPEEVNLLQRLVYNKLNTDPKFVKLLVATMPAEKRAGIWEWLTSEDIVSDVMSQVKKETGDEEEDRKEEEEEEVNPRLAALELYLEKQAAKKSKKNPEQSPKKTPEMESFLDMISKQMFGRSRKESLENKTCVMCGGDASEFETPLNAKEFEISGLCQKCQNATFRDE